MKTKLIIITVILICISIACIGPILDPTETPNVNQLVETMVASITPFSTLPVP